jgi:phage nucleotide-binding protein
MAIKLTNTREASLTNGIKLCVYGMAGAGKTVLCATTGAPTLIISAEAGLLSLRGVDIPVVEVKTIADLQEVYQYLTETQEGLAYEWICLDSISEIAEVCLNEARAASKDPRMAYGDMQEKMETLIRAFRDLPRNVYFTAKMESLVDDAGVLRYQPMLPGRKLPNGLAYFFDEVFFYAVGKDAEGNPTRWLQTQPDLKHQAKDRSGALDACELPDLAHIAAKINQTATN